MKYPIMRTEESKAGLRSMLSYINNKTKMIDFEIVEVGAYEGDATRIFSKYCLIVTAVDPWKSGKGDITDRVDMDKIFDRFRNNINGYPNIMIMRMDSLKAANQFDGDEFDMVYIDASHEYKDVKADIEAWLPRVKPGGWICGHDYRGMFPGVIKAVDELLGAPEKIFPDSSWIKRKTKTLIH